MATRQKEKKEARLELKRTTQPRFVSAYKHVPMSARKVRLVADLVRSKNVGLALDLLQVTSKRAALFIQKTIKAALANARQSGQVADEKRLIVERIVIGEGPGLPRFMPRSMGRAFAYKRYRCHIDVALVENRAIPVSAEPVVREAKTGAV